MTLREFYTAVDGDYEDAAGRLPGGAFLLRFLRMLPKDGSMAQLTAAMASGSAETAFRAAHTLKGIALNLSLTALANACAAMTEALRGSAVMPESAPALYDAVVREYGQTVEALDRLEA